MASDVVTQGRRPPLRASERRDTWWVEPLIVVAVLGSFIVYATWAALINAEYFYKAHNLLSPFYSPCIAHNCNYQHVPIIGSWWKFSPAILILWMPLGLRLTCYYYRKAYYRSFFWAPPACAVPDAAKRYSGETRFPFLLQNIHRYFFWLSLLVIVFLWWDVVNAFIWSSPSGFHMGIGTLVLLVATSLLTLYSLSCHSCRHLCGGCLDAFHIRPLRARMWRIVSRLTERHMLLAWLSLFAVALADLYVRLVASGAIRDVRFF